MKKGNLLLMVIVPLLVVGSVSCTYYQNPTEPDFEFPEPELSYIGSEACEACHQDIYNTFENSGHPYILQQIEDGLAPTYPFTELDYVPPYFQNGWDDVTYAIGGFAWKSQYIDQNGYVYTGNDAQYNFQDGSIVPYHADQDPGTQIYDCGKCHSTGYLSVADGGEPQDGLPGMGGEFFAAGVQCEACHGMGSDHRSSQSADDIIVDNSPEACGSCHYRNEDHTIAASDGFILNREQYDEMISAGHQELSCVACHDPHVSVKHGQTGGIIRACMECHEDMKNPTHRGADCITCHMAYATKSAVDINKYVGDVKTHIFKINPAADGEMFRDDGNLANGATGVTLGYPCYQCHRDPGGVGGGGSYKSLEQLSAKATGYHD